MTLKQLVSTLVFVALTASSIAQRGADAALAIYSSRSEWAAAVGAHQTESFESVTDFTTLSLSGATFATDAFDIIIDSNHGGIRPTTDYGFNYPTPGLSGVYFVGDVHSHGQLHPHFNTITFRQPIVAFAVNFDAIDEGGIEDVRIAGETLKVPSRLPERIRSSFLGVVSTTPFTVVDIRNANGKYERYAMDDVSFVTVPEPAAAIVAIVAAASIASFRRQSL